MENLKNKRSFAHTFLTSYITANCDYILNADTLHLPSCVTMGDIYHEYKHIALDCAQTPISDRYFSLIFDKDFDKVRIPKVCVFGIIIKIMFS